MKRRHGQEDTMPVLNEQGPRGGVYFMADQTEFFGTAVAMLSGALA
jgi:hypothetical protein